MTSATAGANVQQAVPFLGVADMERSRRFYADGLGLQMTKHWIDRGRVRWCWLRRGVAALMLQEFLRDGDAPRPPGGPLGLGVTIVFVCDDALAISREATARGLAASRPFVGNGMWVAWLRDPDGRRVEFESATDVPEETVLADDPRP